MGMQVSCGVDREVRKYLGETFRDLAVQKDCNVIEGHLLPDHVHMLISIPPKYAVSQVVGYIKGKSAIHIALNGTFAFYVTHDLRNRILGWYRDQHVYMIGQKVPLYNVAILLHGEVTKCFSQILPHFPIHTT